MLGLYLTKYLPVIVEYWNLLSSIMADKGFDIAYDELLRGANLNTPPLLKNRQQLSKKNVILTRQIASLRIHVERAILAASNSIVFYLVLYH